MCHIKNFCISECFTIIGSLIIASTHNCTLFLKIGFMIAGGSFYSYYVHQDKSDKESKIIIKKILMHTKRFNTFS